LKNKNLEMFRIISFLVLLAYCLGFVSSKLVELDDIKFNELVGGEVPIFVQFCAPWSSQCRDLAQTYEALADAYEHVNDKIIIARIDADKYKDIGKAEGIKKYPTIKLYESSSKEGIEFTKVPVLDDFISFIDDKTGLVGKQKKVPNFVVDLDESSFDRVIGDKHVMVEFYAPWCGHCKKLAPIYEKVANTFHKEKNVVIARVDAEANKILSSRYNIEGFPTVYFFEAYKSRESPIPYTSGRDELSFVRFLNDKCGTHRVPGGGLNNSAGRDPEIDKLVRKYILTDHPVEKSDLRNFIRRFSIDKKDRSTQFYFKMVEKIEKNGRDFIFKEYERVKKILQKFKVEEQFYDDFKIRLNILEVFRSSANEAIELEKEAIKEGKIPPKPVSTTDIPAITTTDAPEATAAKAHEEL